MLLYLMDRERFRRMGDVKERESSLLLLAATTEVPNTALLPTFRRRIPMTISLPGLNERTMMERYELLRAFFTTECSSIGANIHVAPQALRALLLYTSVLAISVSCVLMYNLFVHGPTLNTAPTILLNYISMWESYQIMCGAVSYVLLN